MGHAGAAGFAEQVALNNIRLEQALSWHLSGNHYPPLPGELIPVAKAAIEKANEGEWDFEIPMPDNIDFRDQRTVSVALAVETMHLDAFIQGDEYV